MKSDLQKVRISNGSGFQMSDFRSPLYLCLCVHYYLVVTSLSDFTLVIEDKLEGLIYHYLSSLTCTVGTRIPNAFGFRMVEHGRFMVPTVRIPNAKHKPTIRNPNFKMFSFLMCLVFKSLVFKPPLKHFLFWRAVL